jgi:hypothetical protein
MELAAAIASLAHNDPSIQSEASGICETFQTPAAFDFKTCASLIGADQPVQLWIFGYNSLRFTISAVSHSPRVDLVQKMSSGRDEVVVL